MEQFPIPAICPRRRASYAAFLGTSGTKPGIGDALIRASRARCERGLRGERESRS